MKPRTRKTESSRSIGYMKYAGGQTQFSYPGQFRDQCTDYWQKKVRKNVYNFLPPSDVDIQHDVRIHPVVNAKVLGGSIILENQTDYFIESADIKTSLFPKRGSSLRIAENNLFATEVLARSNPFRAGYSVPVAIFELLDISSMFRLIGRTFMSFFGGAYLNYRFGWLAFERDIRTLAQITSEIISRIREFESLGRHGGLRRRVNLPSDQITENSVVPIHSSSALFIYGQRTGHYVVRRYGVVRWRPKASFDAYLRKCDKGLLALREVLDLSGELRPDTFWEMVPFSWLADYFIGIGDFLAASRGEGFIEPFDLVICRNYEAREVLRPLSQPSSGSIARGKYHTIIKSRDVWSVGAFPPPRIQFITGSQAKVMGALALQLLGHVR